MAFCSREYFETVESIQKIIHEREKRRHELEEELFAYTRSEERLAKQKCTKMRHYHKELLQREQQAKARNLELLRSVESLVLNATEFSVDYTVLHHLKLECANHIETFLEEKKKREPQEKNDLKEQSSSFPLSTEQSSCQPAVISKGWQTLKDTLVEDGVTSTHLPTELIANNPLASVPQSCLLMDARVSKASGSKALSDDILNCNDFPERQLVFDCDFFTGERVVCGSKQSAAPHITLKASEVCSHHRTVNMPESNASLQHHSSQSPSQDTTHTRSSSALRTSVGKEEAESAQERQPILDQAKGRSSSILSSCADVTHEPSLGNVSDVSVSLSGGLHEQHKPGRAKPIQDSEQPQNKLESGGNPFPMPEHRLTVDDFFYLLNNIEERLPARDANLYSSSPVSDQKLREIVSLCNHRGQLSGTELNVCGAVVLQQLPWLLWDAPHGRLLHSELVNAQWSNAADAADIRSKLSGDGAALWERCFTHALQLLRQEVLPLNRIVQLFTPLLVPHNASYTDKAEVLLKRLLTRASETHSLESEESSSCSLPSLLNDSVEIKTSRPFKNSFNATGTHEVQSGEEDSADQSPVESIPIRETKAYQLLKQSVTQEKQWRNGEKEEDDSDLEWSGLSDVKNTQPSEKRGVRKDPKKKTQSFTAVQSKAFWGDSDDTNSDIEMALRPQSHTNNSDFDDFYD